MSGVISLVKSLGYRNNNQLQDALFRCANELFGLDREQYTLRWRERVATDGGTLRGYMQPTAEALFEKWKECRDPSWLYSHPEYKWDSIGVSVCQTHATVASGIKLLRDRGVRVRLAFDWGAGPGFSALMLAKNLPDAEIHYNELNPDLVRVFEWFKAESGIENAHHVDAPNGIYDLVQAYEIAEHIVHASMPGIGDPLTETDTVLAETADRAHFLHSSCWNAEKRWFTLGHFLRYNIDGDIVDTSRANMHFKRAMARRGWSIAGVGWNSRPFLYQRS